MRLSSGYKPVGDGHCNRSPLSERKLVKLASSLHADDRILDLRCVRSEFTSQLVEVRIGQLLESGFIHLIDDRDADSLEFICRLVLEAQRHSWLLHVDLIGGRPPPLLLLVRQALPKLRARPD